MSVLLSFMRWWFSAICVTHGPVQIHAEEGSAGADESCREFGGSAQTRLEQLGEHVFPEQCAALRSVFLTVGGSSSG